jgi:hypothetical protein
MRSIVKLAIESSHPHKLAKGDKYARQIESQASAIREQCVEDDTQRFPTVDNTETVQRHNEIHGYCATQIDRNTAK